MLRPPIPRMGGKSQLRKKIINMLPVHSCYTEPFFGAGWVYFGKEASKAEVINDIDGELINLFRVIKYHEEELKRQLQYEVSSRQQFNVYKSIDIKYMTDIQRAARYMYIISQSFAARGNTYGYGTTKSPAPQIFNTDNIAVIRDRLRNTYIENLDFSEIIKRYDRLHTLHFCDPPYFKTEGYGVEFGKKEHLNLRDILTNIEGKFILTINDHEEVREWYTGYYITETEVRYSVSKESKARCMYKELIISNFKPSP
ncbi:MAG: DNA adenine methylase [Flavobacteriales bacterium]|nr:DNA adenine methylase [Flavobacteriales bacterium]